MRAIVVGAGIGGLSTALSLRNSGWDVVVFERAPELREVGAGISLWANALRGLEWIGAREVVEPYLLPATEMEIRVRGGQHVALRIEERQLEPMFGYRPPVAMIHRAELVAALASRMPDDTIRFGHELRDSQIEAESVGVSFTNGAQETADILIGADGLNSVVRRAVLGASDGDRVELEFADAPRYSGYTCWRGVCSRKDLIPEGYLGEWWGRGKRIGLTTMTGDRLYWWATANRPPGEKDSLEKAALLAAFGQFTEPVPELFQSTAEEDVLRNDIFDRIPQRGWSKGRAILIGDAAHPTTPNVGQGGCMAIEDGVALGHLLGFEGGKSSLTSEQIRQRFRRFEKLRFARTTKITRASHRFGGIGQWESKLACTARDWLVRTMLSLTQTASMPQFASYDIRKDLKRLPPSQIQ